MQEMTREASDDSARLWLERSGIYMKLHLVALDKVRELGMEAAMLGRGRKSFPVRKCMRFYQKTACDHLAAARRFAREALRAERLERI